MPKKTIMQVTVGSVCMTDHPDFSAESTNELLYGETVEIHEEMEDEDGVPWVSVTAEHDGYRGCVALDALSAEIESNTHKVYALRSFVYPEPDVKTLPILALSFMSRVRVTNEERNGFVRIKNSGWIWKDHLLDLHETVADFTATAERFIGTPYLWGGRTSFGLDCSALVQLATIAAGHTLPRDSGDQKNIKHGKLLDKADRLERGDLVFFKGHVGIMVDDKNLLNATARSMDTRTERLSTVAKSYQGITAIRRLS